MDVKTTDIKISILVPVYNTGELLRRSIKSLLDQTLSEIEIIVINDGSTDNSDAIIHELLVTDPRIKYINLPQNGGVSKARNSGMAVATGEFIGFLDSDDEVDADYYESLYKYAPGNDIVRGIRLVDGRHGKNEYGCLVPSIVRRALFDKSPVTTFPEDKSRGEDTAVKRELLAKTPAVYEVPDTGSYYHYIRRENSLSNYTLNRD